MCIYIYIQAYFWSGASHGVRLTMWRAKALWRRIASCTPHNTEGRSRCSVWPRWRNRSSRTRKRAEKENRQFALVPMIIVNCSESEYLRRKLHIASYTWYIYTYVHRENYCALGTEVEIERQRQ